MDTIPKSATNLLSKKFGFLTVLNYAGSFRSGTGIKHCVTCQCSCDKKTTVVTGNLTNGKTTSCGCVRKGRLKRSKNKIQYENLASGHGLTTNEFINHPISQSYVGAHSRCENNKVHNWKYWGGNGVSVCERWTGPDGLKHFWEDMFPTWSPKKTLDRIKGSPLYSKETCKWSTPQEQARNRRSNRIVTLNGLTACLADHCDRLGLDRKVVGQRLNKGWEIEKAFSPVYFDKRSR